MPAAWIVEDRTDDPGAIHFGVAVGGIAARIACRGRVPGDQAGTGAGSTQPSSVVDPVRAAAGGLSVVRRRTGGGAVLVTPDDPVWIDVWVPAGDPLWSRDVGRAFDWMGETWGDGPRAAGRGRRGRPPWWVGLLYPVGVAGLLRWGGNGEVVADDGRKLVGIAQRRNRSGAWFQSACHLRWDSEVLVGVLALTETERAQARSDLDGAVVGLGELCGLTESVEDRVPLALDPARVVSAFLASLPSPR